MRNVIEDHFCKHLLRHHLGLLYMTGGRTCDKIHRFIPVLSSCVIESAVIHQTFCVGAKIR